MHAGVLTLFLVTGMGQTPGPIVAVDTSATIGPGVNTHPRPRVASGGGVIFSVFNDHRDGSSIFAARTDLNGVPLESQSFRVSDLSVPSSDPAIAFDGVNFLV